MYLRSARATSVKNRAGEAIVRAVCNEGMVDAMKATMSYCGEATRRKVWLLPKSHVYVQRRMPPDNMREPATAL
jgi:hypothetical protein